VYCPKCGVEYREGFTECADCRVLLVTRRPPDDSNPEDSGSGDPDLEPITVLVGNDRLLLASAKGLLEDAHIPFYALGDEIRPAARFGGTGIHPWWAIQVAADRQEEARTLLRIFRRSLMTELSRRVR